MRGAKHARRATRACRSGTAACCGPCLACLPALLLVCLCGPACRPSAQIRCSAPARACWVFHSRTRRKRTGDAARARLNGLGFPLAVREHPRLNEGVGLRPVPGDVRWTARQEDTQTKCHSRILRVCGVSVFGCFPGASWDPSWGQGFHPGDPGMVGAILATVLLGQFGFVVRDLIVLSRFLPL